jgi:hypothetical protein
MQNQRLEKVVNSKIDSKDCEPTGTHGIYQYFQKKNTQQVF